MRYWNRLGLGILLMQLIKQVSPADAGINWWVLAGFVLFVGYIGQETS